MLNSKPQYLPRRAYMESLKACIEYLRAPAENQTAIMEKWGSVFAAGIDAAQNLSELRFLMNVAPPAGTRTFNAAVQKIQALY